MNYWVNSARNPSGDITIVRMGQMEGQHENITPPAAALTGA